MLNHIGQKAAAELEAGNQKLGVIDCKAFSPGL